MEFLVPGNMTSVLQAEDENSCFLFKEMLKKEEEQAGEKLNEDKKSKENDVEFYYEMQQARKKDTERLKNDKTFWEFVKEGEDAMQIPEKEKIVASSFEQQQDFNNDIAVKRDVEKNKENKLIPYWGKGASKRSVCEI